MNNACTVLLIFIANIQPNAMHETNNQVNTKNVDFIPKLKLKMESFMCIRLKSVCGKFSENIISTNVWFWVELLTQGAVVYMHSWRALPNHIIFINKQFSWEFIVIRISYQFHMKNLIFLHCFSYRWNVTQFIFPLS